MMFCPKCKSLMLPKGKELVCSCGYKQSGESATFKEEGKKAVDVAVVEKEEKVNVIIDAECPRCKNDKAETWEIQTRSVDEPPTRFHKCTKCGHTWREYK